MIEIAAELQRQMKDIEYKFDTKFMMWKRRTKDASPFQHTARTWPLHFGLFSTSWYSDPQFQATTTFITKIAGRETIVSDGDCFHHSTADGVCSCGDDYCQWT
jgi:hypothetical protein